MAITKTTKRRSLLGRLAIIGALIAIAAMTFFGCDNGTGGDSLSPPRGVVRAATPIYSVDDLIAINDDPSGDYVLEADLTLTDWTPIGLVIGTTPPYSVTVTPFTGTFDGNKKTITLESFDAAVLSNANIAYLGVFAHISGGTVGDLTVNIQTPAITPASTPSFGYIGGLAGYADTGAAFNAITITGSLAVEWNMAFTGWGTGILSVGGVSGYNDTVKITNSVNGAVISGKTTAAGSGARVGGIIGYGSDATLSVLSGNGNVTADGQGHNTSAGGVAGYIENSSDVVDSNAEGAIWSQARTLGALTGDNAYMVYAGGLVGYSGASSAIQHSNATGTVRADAPYPYAGGLLGYNYGALGGTGGSTVTTSYATGEVSASSDNALPYAGGLAGYSSSSGSKIVDCYARGAVTARTTTSSGYGWAGGIVGGNAQDSVVQNCYATGTVTASVYSGALQPYPMPNTREDAIAGGIVGYNYFVAARVVRGVTETATGAQVDACAALNGVITADSNNTGTPEDARRVVGLNGIDSASAGTLTKNVANEYMALNPTPDPLENTAAGRDGEDVDTTPDQSVFEALGWDFSASGEWVMGSDGYPSLR